MKKSLPFLTLSFVLLISFIANSQVFPWSSYESGSRSYSKTVNGNSMTVTVTGSGFSSDYPAYISDGSFLATSVDWSNKTTTVTYTITFSTPVTGVNFKVYDVDQSSGWDDKVTITAVNSTGATIYPAITGTSYASVSGTHNNILEGTGNNSSFTNSPATVNFNTNIIKTITIVYGVGSSSPNNPNTQLIGFSQIGYLYVLPVKLISFTGKAVTDNVSLVWKTAEQIDLDHYDIERATASGFFENIGSVKATSDLTGDYSYTDYHVVSATSTVSYRLKMVDMDGGFTYSEIISVKISGQVNVDVRPTLVNSSEPVSVIIASSNNNSRYDINMYSMDGRIVSQKKSVSAGTVYFETSNLRKGMYVVKVEGGDANNSFRIVVK